MFFHRLWLLWRCCSCIGPCPRSSKGCITMESMLFASTLAARSGGRNRGDNHAETNSTGHSDNEQGIMSRIKRSVLMCMIPRCLHRDDQPPTSRSNVPKTSYPAYGCWICFGMGFRPDTFHNWCYLWPHLWDINIASCLRPPKWEARSD